MTSSLTLSVTVLVSCSLDTDKARAALQVCAARKQQVGNVTIFVPHTALKLIASG